MFQENINLENCIVQLISYEKNIYIYLVVNFKNEITLNKEMNTGSLNQKVENINFYEKLPIKQFLF